ncbi:hypothetical protein KR054_010058, partial [Drosophila jambulina]
VCYIKIYYILSKLSKSFHFCAATPLNPGNVIINGDCRVCNVRG